MMMLVQFAYLADARHGILVIKMTAQCIARVSGVHHDTAVTQHFSRLANQTRIGVVRVDGKKLGHKIQISSQLMEQLAIPLSCQKTATKWLVMQRCENNLVPANLKVTLH